MQVPIIIRSLLLLLFLNLISGCQKDKTRIIEGVLLYSQTNPTPVTNYELNMFQRGGNAILMGTSSSSASAVTDNSGRFRFEFTAGKGYFLGIPVNNGSAASLSGNGNTVFPGMMRDVFPDSIFYVTKKMYLVKEIQRYLIQIIARRNVVPADSVIIRVSTKAGEIEKLYTGLTINSGSSLTIDTIPDVIASFLSISSGGYRNPIWLPSSSNRNRNIYIVNDGLIIGRDDELERNCEIVIF
jgi:hypothetical protein